MSASAPLRRAAPRPLSPAMVRRRRPQLLAAPPAARVPAPVASPSDGLRFFTTCYAAGLVFFLVMLS